MMSIIPFRSSLHLLSLMVILFLFGKVPSVPLQQVTETMTLTPSTSPTMTETPTVGTLTVTLTTSVTSSPSATQSVSLTPTTTSQTFTPTPTFFSTVTLLPTSTPIVIDTQSTPTAPIIATPGGPTATLKPLPSFTYIFPTPSVTPELLTIARQPDEPALTKGLADILRRRAVIFSACLFILIVWMILGIWFVFVVKQTD
jgi:hypothetical protein